MGTWVPEPSPDQLAVNRAGWTSAERRQLFFGFMYAISTCILFCLTTPFEVYVRVLSPDPWCCWKSKFSCLQYCVPLSHSSRFWSKPLRFATKPCPNHYVPLSRTTSFVVIAIALLTQTHPQRHLVDQLVSLRRSQAGTLSTKDLRLIAQRSCGSPIMDTVVDPARHERHPNR